MTVSQALQLAAGHQQAGRRQEAERLYRAIVQAHPHPTAWAQLGHLLRQAGQGSEARAAYQKALALAPGQAPVLRGLGLLAADEGQLGQALLWFDQALALHPDNPDDMGNRFTMLHWLGRHDEAEAQARRMVQVAPGTLAAHLALASVLTSRQRYAEAHAVLQHLPLPASLSAQDLHRLAFTHANLLRPQQRWHEAEQWMRRLLQAVPQDREALEALAGCLLAQGQASEALAVVLQLLPQHESAEARRLFIGCLKAFAPIPTSEAMRETVQRAIEQPWDLPTTFVSAGMALLKLTPAVGDCIARASQAWPARLDAQDLFGADGLGALAGDPLLHAMLVSMPLCSLDIERCLTMARQALLRAAVAGAEVPGSGATGFWCALARQCFINEYVYPLTDAESRMAGGLKDALAAALARGGDIPPLWPVAVAAYAPLMGLPGAQRLLQRRWPDEVTAVLVQQVAEPLAERQLGATIPLLTPIEGAVSLAVQNQYEENPYPRWVRVPPAGPRNRVGAELRQLFPLSRFQPSEMFENPELLIAGCGTGQHAILTAQRFHATRVLALDLSLASLSYAKRKTVEAGLSNTIDYAQADLLRLGALGRRFDVIESVGVLHHLDDPWLGWRTLLSVLRPRGVMRLGFYSALARHGVVRARSLIARQSYPATPDGVRRCRQDLAARDTGDGFGGVMASSDFYSVSACRDLLFNVQEHRLTLDGIAAFLREHGLNFLGFELHPSALAAYRQRFADDPAATDLGNWQVHEVDNPGTFLGMYQFWVQRGD